MGTEAKIGRLMQKEALKIDSKYIERLRKKAEQEKKKETDRKLTSAGEEFVLFSLLLAKAFEGSTHSPSNIPERLASMLGESSPKALKLCLQFFLEAQDADLEALLKSYQCNVENGKLVIRINWETQPLEDLAIKALKQGGSKEEK